MFPSGIFYDPQLIWMFKVNLLSDPYGCLRSFGGRCTCRTKWREYSKYTHWTPETEYSSSALSDSVLTLHCSRMIFLRLRLWMFWQFCTCLPKPLLSGCNCSPLPQPSLLNHSWYERSYIQWVKNSCFDWWSWSHGALWTSGQNLLSWALCSEVRREEKNCKGVREAHAGLSSWAAGLPCVLFGSSFRLCGFIPTSDGILRTSTSQLLENHRQYGLASWCPLSGPPSCMLSIGKHFHTWC